MSGHKVKKFVLTHTPTLGQLSVVVVILIENRSIRFHKNVEFQLIEM